jgi:predicted nucleic acid-binding protein
MIVYADPSALVKLFVAEQGSELTHDALVGAWMLGTVLLTRAELGAALSRGARRGLITESEALTARRQVDAAWATWVRIAVDENLVLRAEALAWEHGLRGYDAIHLASALNWQEYVGHPIVLATFDRELWEAAQEVGLTRWPEEWPEER